MVKGYGQIICDECHHVSAVGFEQIMKNSPAKYKYGLTATLKRKDGKERYVGEGFDYPILDTLFLTLPISYDYLDSQIDLAMKMYGKRCKGYRSMGYEIVDLHKK